jgi:hypothetical protein
MVPIKLKAAFQNGRECALPMLALRQLALRQ